VGNFLRLTVIADGGREVAAASHQGHHFRPFADRDQSVALHLLDQFLNIFGRACAILGIVKGSSIPPQFLGRFHQNGRKTLVGNGESRRHARQPASDHQRRLHHLVGEVVQRLKQRAARYRHAHEVFCLFRCGARFSLVHPGILFADVGQFEKIRVQTGLTHGVPEQRLMRPRSAGSHHDPVQLLFVDNPLDFLLLIRGTRKHAVARVLHSRQRLCVGRHLLDVHHPRDVDAAMADENADSRFLSLDVFFLDFRRGHNEGAARIGEQSSRTGRRAASLLDGIGDVLGSLEHAAHEDPRPGGGHKIHRIGLAETEGIDLDPESFR